MIWSEGPQVGEGNQAVSAKKLEAGQQFPPIVVKKLGGGKLDLSNLPAKFDWRIVVVYRGKHCPFCTEYLVELNDLLEDFNNVGLDVVALSADSEERANMQIPDLNLKFDVGYDISLEQMRTLGLYITTPRSEAESDRPFAEPAFFVINEKNQAQIIDISNIAFGRPELKTMLRGLKHIRKPGNNYPIRGTL